ncbi:MAG: polyprenyl synthetase family protein [Burkholderiaceae bacterium]
MSSVVNRVEQFADWTDRQLARCESALGQYLPPADAVPGQLHEAMRYATLGAGKRVRPLLVYAAAEAAGEDTQISETGAKAEDAAACAVEMIHAYSLVHDDLPCMDDDDLRRGRPTVHKQYDEATAMLVGDALQARAFEILANMPVTSVGAALAALGQAAGSAGMAGGQAIDLMSVGVNINRNQLEEMHRRKTGAMLHVSVQLGWMARRPGKPVPAAFDAFARAIGLAFQVVDDILDVEADSATLGKTAGKDAAANKPTYVSVIGLEPSRALAGELHETALAAIEPYGPQAQRLRDIAGLIVLRKH